MLTISLFGQLGASYGLLTVVSFFIMVGYLFAKSFSRYSFFQNTTGDQSEGFRKDAVIPYGEIDKIILGLGLQVRKWNRLITGCAKVLRET